VSFANIFLVVAPLRIGLSVSLLIELFSYFKAEQIRVRSFHLCVWYHCHLCFPAPKHTHRIIHQLSMGPDGIHPRVLKELAYVMAGPLSIIYQRSWESGEVPADEKLASVIPI